MIQPAVALARFTPAEAAKHIRRALETGGSAKHAAGVQWFFKDEIQSHGWYTADLRRAAVRVRREIKRERGLDFLVEVADHLFSGSVLEEKVAAVFLLEKLDGEFGNSEFKRFESWLDRISSWADHDALVHSLIAPMVAAKPARTRVVVRWAKSEATPDAFLARETFGRYIEDRIRDHESAQRFDAGFIELAREINESSKEFQKINWRLTWRS